MQCVLIRVLLVWDSFRMSLNLISLILLFKWKMLFYKSFYDFLYIFDKFIIQFYESDIYAKFYVINT